MTLSLREDNRWNEGYCVSGIIENRTGQAVEWSLSAPVDGRIQSIWNARVEERNGGHFFSGTEPWNRMVRPGERKEMFGFCVAF